MSSEFSSAPLTKCLSLVIDHRGKTPKKLNSDWAKHGYRTVSANNVKFSGLVKEDSIRFLDEKTYKSWMKEEIVPGDLLLTSEAPAGQVFYWDSEEKIAIGQRLFGLRVNSTLDSKYLNYYLQSPTGQFEINKNTTGSTVFGISAKMFDQIIIRYPSKDRQEKIGNLLYSLDKKIEINKKRIDCLEKLSKSLYDYWFVQYDFPNERDLPYKTAGGEMITNDAVGRPIPAGWKTGSLLDIAEYQNGIACQKYRPIGSERLRVIKIREMNDGFSDGTEYVRADIPSKVQIDNGDILFSWSASLDVIMWAGGKGALNQHIFKVTSDKHPKFYYYFELRNYLSHFKMMADTRKTTMGHITQEHLSQSRIVIPPANLLSRFEKIVQPNLDSLIEIKIENEKLLDLKNWLLPLLIGGQVNFS